MKKRPQICTFLLMVMTVLFVVTSCKKENDETTVADIDGNVYHTVAIGAQVWIKENLKTTKLNNGTAIAPETADANWEALTTPGYCWYNNDAAGTGKTYGALYNFAAVSSGKLCPTGWHVPSFDEWATLRDFVGVENEAGGSLKELGTSHWNTPNTGATDEVGFTALPSGERYEDGGFVYLGINNNFWTTTIGPGTDPYGVRMYYDNTIFHMSEFDKGRGLSVRCIKD